MTTSVMGPIEQFFQHHVQTIGLPEGTDEVAARIIFYHASLQVFNCIAEASQRGVDTVILLQEAMRHDLDTFFGPTDQIIN